MTKSRIAESVAPVKTNPVEIERARTRLKMRSVVIYDKRLSMGARLLYFALDEYAGGKGTAWPKQITLAERLNVSRRTIVEWLRELVACGYVVAQKRQRSSLYALAWAGDVKKPAQPAAQISAQQPSPPLLTEPVNSKNRSESSAQQPLPRQQPAGKESGGREDAALSYYALWTGNRITRRDREVARSMVQSPEAAVKAGIMLSILRAKDHVRSLLYCTGAVIEAAQAPNAMYVEYLEMKARQWGKGAGESAA